MTSDTRTPTKTVYVLLALGLALTGLALAPSASAFCTRNGDPVTHGQIYSYQAGGCGTWVDVLGEQVYPLP
jgi:hypothetical protein